MNFLIKINLSDFKIPKFQKSQGKSLGSFLLARIVGFLNQFEVARQADIL